MDEGLFGAGDGDSGQDFDVGVFGPEEGDVSFVVIGVGVDEDVLLFEGDFVPAGDNVIEFVGVINGKLISGGVPGGSEDEFL